VHSICYPIGAILGGISACINQYLRDNQSDNNMYQKVSTDELLGDEDF
jgi:hypothetical protein